MKREPLDTAPRDFSYPPDARVWMEPACERTLRALSLDSFDALIDCEIGQLLTLHETRRAVKLPVPEEIPGPALFLKIFRRTQRQDALGAVLERKAPRSKARS